MDGEHDLNIHESILAVMRDVGAVEKGGYNKMQQFSYRGYDGVINAVSPALKKNGVTIHQKAGSLNIQREAHTNAKGGRVIDVWGTAVFVWTGPEGDTREVEVYADARDLSDKSGAKLETVLNRINLIMTLALPTEDKDPDEDYIESSSAPEGQADPDVVQVIVKAIQADAQAGNVPQERVGALAEQVGIKGRISMCKDVDKLTRLSDLVRLENG